MKFADMIPVYNAREYATSAPRKAKINIIADPSRDLSENGWRCLFFSEGVIADAAPSPQAITIVDAIMIGLWLQRDKSKRPIEMI